MKLVGEYQLSLHVDAPPSLRDDADLPMSGVVLVRGDIPLARDLQPGELLRISVTDADGQPLSSATLKVRQVQFKVLEIGEVTVGIERRHTARLEEGVAVR